MKRHCVVLQEDVFFMLENVFFCMMMFRWCKYKQLHFLLFQQLEIELLDPGHTSFLKNFFTYKIFSIYIYLCVSEQFLSLHQLYRYKSSIKLLTITNATLTYAIMTSPTPTTSSITTTFIANTLYQLQLTMQLITLSS